MLHFLISSFLVTLIFVPFGIFFSKEQTNIVGFSSQLIYATITLSFIALILNFFIPLNTYTSSSIIILSIILIIKNWNFYYNKNFFIFSAISGFIIIILLAESNTYRPDAGLYHLPYIKILNDEKIIFGLSNLHFRFAHISIIQYLSAISNNFIFQNNGIVFSSAVIASAIILNFSSQIFNYLKNNNYNFHFYFLVSILIYIFLKMNRYSEYGNDAPSHFLYFFLLSETLKYNDDKSAKNILNLLLLSVFIILNKITLIMCILFPFIFLNKNNFKKILKNKKIYFILFFGSIWLIKNVIISGCLIYPVSTLCFKSLNWTDIKMVEKVSIENEAWTKSWPNFKNKNIINQKDYLKEFNWIKTWYENEFNKTIKKITPYIIIMLIISFFLKLKSHNKIDVSNKRLKILLLFILLSSSVFWFLKVPVYRYGYSYLISFFGIIFAYNSSKYYITNKLVFKRFIIIILTLCALFFIFKNFNRIYKNDLLYNNYPWPKFYSHDEMNNFPHLTEKIISGKKIYKATNGHCMYGKSPCAEAKTNISIRIKNGYLIFLN
jgi:hypothetical protein